MPILLRNYFLLEKLAHFNCERIPKRAVHAKGAGAHGYFEGTADDFLQQGMLYRLFSEEQKERLFGNLIHSLQSCR